VLPKRPIEIVFDVPKSSLGEHKIRKSTFPKIFHAAGQQIRLIVVFTASLSTFFILSSSEGRKCDFFVRHNVLCSFEKSLQDGFTKHTHEMTTMRCFRVGCFVFCKIVSRWVYKPHACDAYCCNSWPENHKTRYRTPTDSIRGRHAIRTVVTLGQKITKHDIAHRPIRFEGDVRYVLLTLLARKSQSAISHTDRFGCVLQYHENTRPT